MGESDGMEGTGNSRLFPGLGEDGAKQMCERAKFLSCKTLQLDLPHV